MNVNYNYKEVPEASMPFNINNRAFLYGDGLFETMVSHEGKISYLDDHIKRLQKGMKKMGMSGSETITNEKISHAIENLLKSNDIKQKARIKLMVWRKPGGLYTPTDNDFEMLITTYPLVLPEPTLKHVDFSKDVKLSYSKLSGFKTSNCLPYILAGLEMKERKLDDIIILDVNGHISECLASNIFWVKKGIFYTPSLKTGCIAGVMRKNLIKKLKNEGYVVKKVKAGKKALLRADHVFSCNVAGIYPIGKIGKKEYDDLRFWIDDLEP